MARTKVTDVEMFNAAIILITDVFHNKYTDDLTSG